MICPFCKETILDGALKCRHCGSMLNTNQTFEMNSGSITADELTAFIGTNSYYYVQQFSKFTITGIEKFRPTWNWSCFGFTFLWMLYRKMYILAVLTFLIFCVPGINILLHIVAGVVGNYLYYGHVKGKIHEIRASQSPLSKKLMLQEMGGVHRWVIMAGAIISIIMAILFAMFFSAMISFMGQHMTGMTI